MQAREGEQTLFLVEIQQAGIFVIRGYSPQERDALVGSFCPSTLYPFAREAVALLRPVVRRPVTFVAWRESTAGPAEAPAEGAN